MSSILLPAAPCLCRLACVGALRDLISACHAMKLEQL